MRPSICAIILSAAVAQLNAATQTISLFSPSNNREISFVIYTPPEYSTTTHRYPVVFDLHGINGAPTNRANFQVVPTLDASIQSGEVLPAIYVFPDGQTNGFYGDAFDGHKQVYSNALLEVLPYVDASYRTLSHRRFRAIEGFSMGGFGALMYAAKRPDLFSAVVDYSGALQTWQALIPSVKLEMYNNIQSNFTPFSVYDQTSINAEWIADLDVKFRMLVGDQDGLVGSNQNYNAFLNTQLDPFGVPDVPLTLVPGIGHDGRAMYETKLGLQFIDEHFKSVTAGDTDLDEDVDFNDLLTLAQNYGTTTGGSWFTGDFTWDGVVDFNDLLGLAQNYGSTNSFSNDWQFAQAQMPEPVQLTIVGGLICLVSQRVRRKRSQHFS